MENTRQRIPLKNDIKAFEVLALAYHFYNKGYYIGGIDQYPRTLIFEPIVELKYCSMSTFTNDLIVNNFTFKFMNYRNEWKMGTRIEMLYDSYKFESALTYDNRTNMHHTGFVNVQYRFDKYTDGVDLQWENFKKAQNNSVIKLKFYEENCIDIANVIRGTAYKTPPITFPFLYGFKKYSNSINKYLKKGIVDLGYISEILNCCDEDMQFKKLYNFKLLKFLKKEKDYVEVTMNKSFTFELYIHGLKQAIKNNTPERIDGAINILVPIVQEIGGINELRNVILHNRILTE